MYEIGPYLRAALKKRGMTQKDLADAMGMTKEHISTICLNKRRPSFDALEKMCSILNMSFSEFFADQTGSHSINLSDNEYSMLCDYRCLSNCERQALGAFVSALRAGHQVQAAPHISPCKREVNGLAAAGQPLFSDADDEFINVPRKYIDTSRYLIIRAKGDSMEPSIENGDYVVAEINSSPSQGELSLVRIEGRGADDEYAIKKFYVHGNEAELRSINPDYEPMTYPLNEVKSVQRIVYVIRHSDACE